MWHLGICNTFGTNLLGIVVQTKDSTLKGDLECKMGFICIVFDLNASISLVLTLFSVMTDYDREVTYVAPRYRLSS